MMASIIISSDIHIHRHKQSSERLEDCLETLEWIFKVACQKNIHNFIFVGDLFQTRQKIDVLTYQKTFEIFQKYQNEVKTWLLLGNHDMWYSETWDISSVFPLGAIKNVNVINNPCVVDVDGFPVAFLPYTKNPIECLQILDSKKLLFAHVAVDGALWNTRYDTYSEVLIEHDGDMIKVDSNIFKDWDQVFLGHYHAAQKLTDKIEYIGSPLQLSYGEAFQNKHIIIYDTDTKEKEYVENCFSPKHYIVPPNKIGDLKLRHRDFLTIETDSLNNPENIEIKKDLNQNYTLSEIKIKTVRKKIQEAKCTIEDARAILQDEQQMAEKYIEQIGTNGLDKNKLLEIFNFIRSKKSASQ